jgi:CRP/FNR family cyclic AMP-dependent transcriptional regulator
MDGRGNETKKRASSSLSINRILEAPWARGLSEELRRRVAVETRLQRVAAHNYVCRKGEPVAHWFGVVEGFVKVAMVSPDGKPISFIGISAGGWFGEGSLLKDEPRRYDGIALRRSVIAYVPRNTFMLLLDSSVSFNRFILAQLNERLGEFVARFEHDRLLGPEARVAADLAALFNPRLYPGQEKSLPISQTELALLFGLSRQTVNRALQQLEAAGVLRVDYRGVTIIDVEGLKRFGK